MTIQLVIEAFKPELRLRPSTKQVTGAVNLFKDENVQVYIRSKRQEVMSNMLNKYAYYGHDTMNLPSLKSLTTESDDSGEQV